MSDELSFEDGRKGACQCGLESCTRFGVLMKPRKDGTRHVRGCLCRPCLNGRSSRGGKAKHRVIAREMGAVRQGYGASSHEESWTIPWARVEVKTGAQAGPVSTRFQSVRAQSEASRPYGDGRPFVGVFWTGGKGEPALAVLTVADLMMLMEAL